ncbi:MAG: site-specific integrase [Roseivirga sp.]
MSLKEALQKYIEAKENVMHGINAAKEDQLQKRHEKEAMTIAELIPFYMEYCIARGEKKWKEKERVLNKELVPTLGKSKVKDISFRDIASIIHDIAIKRGKSTQASRFLSHSKCLFRYAKNYHGLVEINPCADLEAPKMKSIKKRSLDMRDLYLFWHNIDNINIVPVVRLGLKFMLCTLTRGVEVRTMEWSEIDLKDSVWVIPEHKAKNGRRHLIPLNRFAIEVLEEVKQWTGNLQFVFGWHRILNIDHHREIDQNTALGETAFNHALREKFDLLNIPVRFTPHDLRRTGATLLTSIGYSRDWVSKLLNHTPSGVTAQVYDTFDYFEEKRAGIECIQHILERIVSAKSVDFVPSQKNLRQEFMTKGLIFEFLKEDHYLKKANTSMPINSKKADDNQEGLPTISLNPSSYTLSYGLVA